jgi:glycine cleavage system H protein
MVVMGITPTMVEVLGEPYKLSLLQVGTPLSLGDTFGTVEGYKISADLITPVSGVVFEVDEFVLAQSSDGGQIGQINNDPYNAGWLVVIQLANPDELSALLTPQAYKTLVA